MESAENAMGPAGQPGRRVRAWALGLVLVGLAGAWLSRRVEPGVRVERITLAGEPALRFTPADPPSGGGAQAPPGRPVALLAHGVTASKETLFRMGEALAAAGFVAVSVDFPGHGGSPHPFRFGSVRALLPNAARELGGVDVLVGHSMGAYLGSAAIIEGSVKPRLFVALGAVPPAGLGDTRVLVLLGRFEEAAPALEPGAPPPEWLGRWRESQLVVAPWVDHVLEPWSPLLVNAAVDAACKSAGLPTPAQRPARWRMRLLGALLSLGSGIALARLPVSASSSAPRPRGLRGVLIALAFIAPLVLCAPRWLSGEPTLARLPVLGLMTAACAAGLALLVRLRLARWSPAAMSLAFAIVATVAGVPFLGLMTALLALVLGTGALAGALAARGGTPLDGHVAMALVVGFMLGQWFPLPF